jgi:hypothetical protein
MSYPNNLLVPDDGTLTAFSRVTTSTQGPEYGLGTTVETKDGKKYRYVQFKDAVTYVAGQVCTPANITWTAVTNDVSGGSSIAATSFGGICVGVPAQNGYGWVQIAGVATVRSDGSVAADEAVVPHSVDGEADTMAAGEEHLAFGRALDADTGSPVTCSVLLNGW